jgi:glycosyltransferase involved in cell wall biosynthesis
MIILYPANTILPTPRANTIQILNTARELAAQGNEVHLVAKKADATQEEIRDYYGIESSPSFLMHLVPAPRIFRSAKGHESLVLKKTFQLLTHFRAEKKLLFTRDPLFASILLKFRKLFRFRLVYEAHTLFFLTAKETYMPVAWSERKEQRLFQRERRIFSHADGLIFITNSLFQLAQQHFEFHQPCRVLHDGTRIPDQLSSDNRKGGICYSGQLYLWKGMINLLKAMSWVDDGVLHIYGGGYNTVQDDLAEMDKVIRELGLSSKINFHGFKPPSEIPAHITQHSVGVIPLPANIIANHCNSPLKLFDYMANGLAVVASDLSTIREVIEHGKNGHLVEPENPKSLAEGINKTLKDEEYRAKLARDAFRTVQKYSWQNRAMNLDNFLRSL